MTTTIKLAMVGIILLTACKKGEHGVTKSLEPTYSNTTSNSSSNLKVQSDIELVYYNTMLVQMKLKQFKGHPAGSLLAHNKSMNILYMVNGFVTVADAIQGDSYSAIWQEVNIVFNSPVEPYQFFSEAEILLAASGKDPDITLVPTNKIYRGAIIEHTKIQ